MSEPRRTRFANEEEFLQYLRDFPPNPNGPSKPDDLDEIRRRCLPPRKERKP